MKQRIYVFFLILVLVLSVIITSSASTFVLRNGIEWYMTKDKVLSSLLAENTVNEENVFTEQDFLDEWYDLYPLEKTNPKQWIIMVGELSLGVPNEDVQLALGGTFPYGLHVALYSITPASNSDDAYYNRVKELEKQLEKKYGEFKKEDKWKNRNNKKVGDKIYESWKTLDNKTNIYLWIEKKDEGFDLTIQYSCPDREEIELSITDGSIYIEPAFGL